MQTKATLYVIDTLTGDWFSPGESGVPKLVERLREIEALGGADAVAPLLIAAPNETGRARGALLVTGDTDASVIAPHPPGSLAARQRLAEAYARQHCPQAELVYFGDGEPNRWQPPSGPDAADIRLTDSGRKGIFHPDPEVWGEWVAAAEEGP